MNVVAIIQARMGSTRLPGKVLHLLKGRSVLSHVIERVTMAREVDSIVVATTEKPEDDLIVDEAKYCGAAVFQGSEHDVLSRYYHSAKESSADVIVRITSDCPVIDPEVISTIVRMYKGQHCDYISNTLKRSFPRGLDAEVFSFESLDRAYQNAKHAEQREHVTPFIYQNPSLFKIASYECDHDYSEHRWTLDTSEDFMLIERIYEHLYDENPLFNWHSVLDLVQRYPELPLINAHIEQKKLSI